METQIKETHTEDSLSKEKEMKPTNKAETSLEKNKEIPTANKETPSANKIETSLVKRSETSLKNRTVSILAPTLKVTIGVLFYVASFVLSAATSCLFIYYVFQ